MLEGVQVTHLREDDFRIVRFRNSHLQADVIPELGGKIWRLTHLASDKQWLWHNPLVPLRSVNLGDSYDDNWAGGWEELFPNDAPGAFLGKTLPDHGEWWSRSWDWAVDQDSPDRAVLRLSHQGQVTTTDCEKHIVLDADGDRIWVRYQVLNRAASPLRFLFKQHLSVAVTPTHRLELPGGTVTPVDLDFSTRIGGSGPFDWPLARDAAGNSVDLSQFPASGTGDREFVYVEDMPQGWCGIRDLETNTSLRLHFDNEVFPFTWIFMTFGGWRGLYTVVLEPCTNMPKDLTAALESGCCGSLAAGQTLTCSVSVELN